MVDISFDEITMSCLHSIIGKKFESYSCDPFIFSPSVFEIVGCMIEGKTYKLTSDLCSVQRFFSTEDVALLKFVSCESKEIVSKMDNGKLIVNPVEDIICGVDIVNDCEVVTHNGDKRKFYSTKGIIFHLTNGNEISFELGTWFSEMITIQRGYNLIEKFTPINEFYDEWDTARGYIPSCTRDIITIR